MKHKSMRGIVGFNINAGDADFPTRLARGRIPNRDVAAGGNQGAVDSPALQCFERFIRREPFTDSSQIETHVWQKQRRGAGVRIEAEIFPADGCARGGEFFSGRRSFSLPRKAPESHARTDGYVERAIGEFRNLLRAGEDIEEVFADRN